MAKQKQKQKTVNIVNRKARYEFEILNTYEAGIVLYGTEIKSIRASDANLKEAFCVIKDGELFIRAMHIAEYSYGNMNNHVTKRTRKLLMRKAEIRKMERRVREKGFTIIPLRLYLSERGFAKLEIAVGRGKKEFDKRATIKEKENKRTLDRIKKIHRMNE